MDALDELDELDAAITPRLDLKRLEHELGLDLDELWAGLWDRGLDLDDEDDQEVINDLLDGIVATREPDSTAVRRCLDCDNPAMERKGNRGPHPRRCDLHAKERKRLQDAGLSRPRGEYSECCRAWQDDSDPSHTGLCPQHEDSRDETREWDQAHSVSEREARWLLCQLGAADDAEAEIPKGWHIEAPALPAGWQSSRGTWEGRTRPDVYHPDPFQDGHSRQWLNDNREQFTDVRQKSNPVKIGR